MYNSENFSIDFVNTFVENEYERILERYNIDPCNTRSRKIEIVLFLNTIFDCSINYHTLTKEEKEISINNGKKLLKVFFKRKRKIEKELVDNVDLSSYVGNYYVVVIEELEIIKVNRVTSKRVFFSYLHLDKQADFETNTLTYSLWNRENPGLLCDSFMDKDRFIKLSKTYIREEDLRDFERECDIY